uniref:Receptor-like serine/threonine-protein kinase n=1 Tax=Leersia perrieri TaxID=77586 RepID=A0A0D9Y1X3_9ORYZ
MARNVPVEYLYPPYNLTYFHFIDTNGVFLLSRNSTFSAAVFNPGAAADDQQSRFFFSVLHAASRTPVWTATAGSTILQSIVLSLSSRGLALSDPGAAADDAAAAAWSTPPLRSPVTALRLLDSGELLLLDAANATLWSSFDRPTDTILPGQALLAGVPLTAVTSDNDLNPGSYRLLVTAGDALLQWASSSSAANSSSFVTYWALSTDANSVQDSTAAVHSMTANSSGIYLLAANGHDTVFRLRFPSTTTDAAVLLKVDPSGRLRALAMASPPRATLPTVWAAPYDGCDLPLPCRSLGLCTPGTNGSSCSCPDAFSTYSSTGGCSPADGSTLTPSASDSCTSPTSTSGLNYMSLGVGIGYFANKFASPDTSGEPLAACRDGCSGNCSCVGFFYRNSSMSCFLVRNQIGSLFRGGGDNSGAVGFVKTFPASRHQGKGASSSSLSLITIVFGIALPTVAAVLIGFLVYAIWIKRKVGSSSDKKKRKKQHGQGSSGGINRSWFKLPMLSSSQQPSSYVSEEENESADDDEVLIPGLPARLTYIELSEATEGFKTQIGSGGFGCVYKGELRGEAVAVKRMNNLGTSRQGRREFLTEMAVIGNAHHVNLVKLRGFCADRQLLVYEYMNRGSLDQCLFRPNNQCLDWAERMGVCAGAARGLAYLHAGCARKILHCDVKPENILLDDRGGVKIADFGLAKLLSPEQSGLFTTMRGTRGYLAPEWLTNAPISDKADVYSFGMVLLEIVRGRKNCKRDNHQQLQSSSSSSSDGNDGYYFPALALEMHEQGRYEALVDQRLDGKADMAEVERVVRVALCCLHEDAALRPPMTTVSAMLDGTMEAALPRTELLGYLRLYGHGLVDVRSAGKPGKGSEFTSAGGGATSSWSPTSCVSAQQLSGPR